MAEFTTDQRKQLVMKKEAMPDGSYPIRNASDLKNAIQAYGRSANKPATQAWIKKRAKELNLEDLLPESWKEVKQSAVDSPEGTLSHHGILGQKWGVRRSESQLGNSSSKKSAGSEDYQRSKEMLKRGTENLSTKELKDLTTRLQLEQQYKNLNPSDTKKGLDTVKKITAAGTTIATLYALTKTPLGKDVTSAITSAVKDAGLNRAYKMAMGG